MVAYFKNRPRLPISYYDDNDNDTGTVTNRPLITDCRTVYTYTIAYGQVLAVVSHHAFLPRDAL